jgi:hypothetical protein
MKTERHESPRAGERMPKGWTLLPLLLLFFLFFVFPSWGQIDRGTIQGLVKDQSGAVVPGAKIRIIQIATNSTLEMTTNGEGAYTAPNMPAAAYRIVIEKEGFKTFTREPVDVQSRSQITVDVVLVPGSLSESVTVSSEAPILDTAAVNNSVAFTNKLVEELPLIVVGTKRDITGFLDNIPGAGNTNTFVLTLNASSVGATEAFIDGARATERIQKGSLAENGPFLEQVGEVNVVSGAFNAEYGGFGNWFTNVIIKSGTNSLHGSIFDHIGNDKLNARSFFAKARTPYRQNEGGFTLGGPVYIPHLYDGRNKTFFFASLGLFYTRQGAAGLLATVPTQAMVRGDFSGLTASNGSQIPIFDPASTQPDGAGSAVRTQFPNNVIPTDRITPMAKIVSSYLPAPDLPGQINNFYDHRANTWPYYNTKTPLIKIDHSISDKQKVMASYTHQSRPRILWGNPQPGLGPAPAWGVEQQNPLDQIYDQQDTSWKVRMNHDYILRPTLMNHFTIGVDREFNLGQNKTAGQGWDKKLGITGIPRDNGAFPAFTFSGGTAPLAAMGRGYDVSFFALDYTIIENLTWIRGKHSIKMGAEFDRDRINQLSLGNIQGAFAFSNSRTSQPNAGANFGAWGSSVASFLLGAVSSASANIPAETGLRDLRVGAFIQDEWRATPKLTVSYGLRWDYNPSYSEVHNQMSSFQPNIANPGAGGRLGALAFAGQSGLPGKFFATNWKKGFGPRVGFSYQLDPKTVIRLSSGIYYQNAPQQQQTSPSFSGFSNAPSFSAGDPYSPLYYLNTGTFPQNFSYPPLTDPSFLNGQSITWMPANATRLPQTINYNFSIQRQLSRDLSLEAVYLGSRSTHLAFGANYNYLPISYLPLGSLLTQTITSAAATAAGFGSPYPSFVNQTGANTVYQSLRPYPQYTGVTTSPGEGSGQQKFNSLQTKVNKRVSGGLTLFGYFNWQKSFSLSTGQYPGWRYWQLDGQPATSFSVSWAYALPFGTGKPFLKNFHVVSAIVSGWKVNGFVKYSSGSPLTISAASGSLGSIGYGQWGNAVQGTSPYATTSPSEFTPTSKYLNPAAFSVSTGYNFGNLNPNLSWVRGFWFKEENLTLGRVFRIKEKGKLDFSMDFVNPFNFHRWGAPNTSVLSGAAFGTVSSVSAGRTIQGNVNVSF